MLTGSYQSGRVEETWRRTALVAKDINHQIYITYESQNTMVNIRATEHPKLVLRRLFLPGFSKLFFGAHMSRKRQSSVILGSHTD